MISRLRGSVALLLALSTLSLHGAESAGPPATLDLGLAASYQNVTVSQGDVSFDVTAPQIRLFIEAPIRISQSRFQVGPALGVRSLNYTGGEYPYRDFEGLDMTLGLTMRAAVTPNTAVFASLHRTVQTIYKAKTRPYPSLMLGPTSTSLGPDPIGFPGTAKALAIGLVVEVKEWTQVFLNVELERRDLDPPFVTKNEDGTVADRREYKKATWTGRGIGAGVAMQFDAFRD